MAQEFSIVTPSFQQLDWLRLAMASVADQEGVNVEHIIQDATNLHETISILFAESCKIAPVEDFVKK